MSEYDNERSYWLTNLSSRLDDPSFQKMAEIILEDRNNSKGIGLELGCGEGRLINLLPNIYGVDYSTLGMQKNHDNNKWLVCANAAQLPYPDNYFDYIVTNSLHHMPYKRVLQEVHRVLKRDGKFYCFEPNRWHLYNLLVNKDFGIEIVGDRGFYLESLKQEMSGLGLIPEKYRYIILNMERIRFLTRVQKICQVIPTRLFQAWFTICAIKITNS
ncbi:MAG: class I SAM-dependent methyltransferase [Candidatus Scalindua sp.]